MSIRQLKSGYFTVEGLNSFATTFYFYYLYFFMQKTFGFDNKANLLLAALNGFIYMLAAWSGGKFGQRYGYFTALKCGFVMAIVSLACGLEAGSVAGHLVVMAFATIGACFTWPALEALVSEGETPAGIQRMVGIYNVTWAGTGALAYFSGGAMLDKWGLQSLFFIPIAIQLGQLGLVLWLEKQAHRAALPAPVADPTSNPDEGLHRPPIAKARTFLRMAWLANPFAYIAINTLVAVIPGVAKKLELSTMLAGFYCSIWCFSRLAAFFALWFWTRWHYRFRWLLSAYLVLIAGFVTVALTPNLVLLVIAQLFFGAAIGLIYYSSLFYSMDVGETKGEHGGFHEAAIGFGNFAGPAVGATSLYFLPNVAHSGVLAVSGLLLLGFGALLAIWRKQKS